MSKHILSQTATAKMSNIQGNTGTMTRLMFNSGSQKSYISNEVRSMLKLRTLRKERIILKTFGNNDSQLEELDVVQFRVENPYNDFFCVCQSFVCINYL